MGQPFLPGLTHPLGGSRAGLGLVVQGWQDARGQCMERSEGMR